MLNTFFCLTNHFYVDCKNAHQVITLTNLQKSLSLRMEMKTNQRYVLSTNETIKLEKIQISASFELAVKNRVRIIIRNSELQTKKTRSFFVVFITNDKLT